MVTDLYRIDDLLSSEFDAALRELNVEYAAKRESHRLAPPVVSPVSPGLLARRTRTLERRARAGQIKHKHLAPGPDCIEDIRCHDPNAIAQLERFGDVIT